MPGSINLIVKTISLKEKMNAFGGHRVVILCYAVFPIIRGCSLHVRDTMRDVSLFRKRLCRCLC